MRILIYSSHNFEKPFLEKAVQENQELVYSEENLEEKTISNISRQAIALYKDDLNNGLYFLKLIEKSKVIAMSKVMIK